MGSWGPRPGAAKGLDLEAQERDNERGLDALSERVNLLKNVTGGLKNEADRHNRILDGMDGSMMNVRGFLGSVNDKMHMVMSDKQGKRTVMLASGTAAVLFLIWYLSH